MSFKPTSIGYFGKLPVHADFIRAGLPEDFVAPWDAWCRTMMLASRAKLGEDWSHLWWAAPVWRFVLPQNACGSSAVLGVWRASTDKVGRAFPLVLCALAPSAEFLIDGGAWLTAMADLADDAEDMGQEQLAARLAEAQEETPIPRIGWWTHGGPRVVSRWLRIIELPPPELAAALLSDDASEPAGGA